MAETRHSRNAEAIGQPADERQDAGGERQDQEGHARRGAAPPELLPERQEEQAGDGGIACHSEGQPEGGSGEFAPSFAQFGAKGAAGLH